MSSMILSSDDSNIKTGMDDIKDLRQALPTPVLGQCSAVVHVEVCQKSGSTVRASALEEPIIKLLHDKKVVYGDLVLQEFDSIFLRDNVTSIAICDTDLFNFENQMIDLCQTDIRLHIFQLHDGGPSTEELDDEDIAAANHWLLPSRDFNGLWENLIFDSNIKSELLQYAASTLLFSDKMVDSNIISWNKVVLLHGPPGTGKTSLCKALAQKLCINLSDRYKYGQLIEINSHSLFSKWFSESGKLVLKMFQKIQEFVDDTDSLVCVLIDEVESVTAARKSAMSGSEPSDAIRVVNALLTQIDQIKRNSNVIILTTSNITGAIDLAFVDRADIKQYIGLPSPAAIYKMYQTGLNELMRVKIISPAQQLLDLRALELILKYAENDATRLSLKLRNIANASQGLSGRTLKKLPFIAHATFVQVPSVSMDAFLDALEKAVVKQFKEAKELNAY